MPPANASSVTWMLLNITCAENADASEASKSRPSTGGSAAPWNSAGIRPAAVGESTSAPHEPEQRRHHQQRPRREDQPRPLGQPHPVATGEEVPDGLPPLRAPVDRRPAAQHERFEPPQ